MRNSVQWCLNNLEFSLELYEANIVVVGPLILNSKHFEWLKVALVNGNKRCTILHI